MRRRLCSALIVFLVTAPRAKAQAAGGPVQQLSWLTGCWRAERSGNRIVEEQWMAPRARTMLGMGRTVRDTTLVEFEHTQILERNGRAIYHAEPSGQKPADFEATLVSDTLVIFSNPAHDFPQRVIYQRRGADSLDARVEGTAPNSSPRSVLFSYARVGCAPK